MKPFLSVLNFLIVFFRLFFMCVRVGGVGGGGKKKRKMLSKNLCAFH